MAKQWSYKKLEALGRQRLSPNFYMREFLHSEIAQLEGLTNAPDNPSLAIEAGSQLCEKVLEPIHAVWGKVSIRSGYRSPEVNAVGQSKRWNCASNESNYGAHIWDALTAEGLMGATACIVIPAYQDYFERTGDWASLAWWIHHHIPEYNEMCFFREQCAFNIRWREGDASQTIRSFVVNPDTGDKSSLISGGDVQEYYSGMSPQQRYAKAQELILV
ncbi:MAG: hypothetical protein V7739_09075 [Motiliproteus sp.]